MRRAMLAGVLGVGVLAVAPAARADGHAWQVRARAVYLDFANSQASGLPLAGTTRVEAESRWIPEVDVSYFFTANLAAEWAMTYPQTLDIKVGGSRQEHIKVLPCSLVLQYHATRLGSFRPYAGVGLNLTGFSDRDRFLGGAASVDGSSAGLVGQLGCDVWFNRTWGANLDVKYLQMKTDVRVVGTKIGTIGLDPWALGVGATCRF